MNNKKSLNNKYLAYLFLLLTVIFTAYLINTEINENQENLTIINNQIQQAKHTKINLRKKLTIPKNLPQLALFGQYQAPLEGSRNTTLAFKLFGIIQNTTNPKASSAIISINNNIPKVINIGETISPGITLYKTFPDKVILKNNGKLESLELPKFK